MLVLLAATAGLGALVNALLPVPVLNFMLLGMSFSAAFANCIPEGLLENIMRVMNPVIGVGLIVVILNLGAPLDYADGKTRHGGKSACPHDRSDRV